MCFLGQNVKNGTTSTELPFQPHCLPKLETTGMLTETRNNRDVNSNLEATVKSVESRIYL